MLFIFSVFYSLMTLEMNITLPFSSSTVIWFSLLSIAGLVAISGSLIIPRLIGFIITHLAPASTQVIYQQVITPFLNQIGLVLLLMVTDGAILIVPLPEWMQLLEIPLGLVVVIATSWLGFRLFDQFFEVYWLNAAFKKKRKLNSDILIVIRVFANILILLIVIFIFAQTHHINIIGLLASLGIGGLAVAFAAQKTLEQLLGGIVLYLDRPFVVDDYIHLPDRTLGRVESIGWRSTKIRTSGKGSLVIIPNNVLTQVSIENLTNAKKIISLIYLTFYYALSEEEKALIRQIILESTQDIFGIDHRVTQVTFKEIMSDEKSSIVQAQITFFILGSGDVSMDFRSQLLEIAEKNITQKLQDCGIEFEIEEKKVNVTSPVNI